MPLSTEVFVLAIFIAGGPFFYFILKNSELQGHRFFILAYAFLTLSNIFTVIEEFWLNTLFNICEHFFISLGSIMILLAVSTITARKQVERVSHRSEVSEE